MLRTGTSARWRRSLGHARRSPSVMAVKRRGATGKPMPISGLSSSHYSPLVRRWYLRRVARAPEGRQDRPMNTSAHGEAFHRTLRYNPCVQLGAANGCQYCSAGGVDRRSRAGCDPLRPRRWPRPASERARLRCPDLRSERQQSSGETMRRWIARRKSPGTISILPSLVTSGRVRA